MFIIDLFILYMFIIAVYFFSKYVKIATKNIIISLNFSLDLIKKNLNQATILEELRHIC